MKEAIEKLIKDLEDMRKKNQAESYKNVSVATSAYFDGVGVGLLMSIDSLKGVLAQHEAQQIRSKEDNS